MTTTIMDALSSDGEFAPIFKFADPGDSITGVIVEEPATLPLTVFGGTEPKIGKDGKPVMQIVLVLATEQPKDEHHDGRWRVFIDKPLMRDAVLKAVRAAGAPTLRVGDEITLTYIGYRELGSGQAKDFTAKYLPAQDDGPIGIAELGDAWPGE